MTMSVSMILGRGGDGMAYFFLGSPSSSGPPQFRYSVWEATEWEYFPESEHYGEPSSTAVP